MYVNNKISLINTLNLLILTCFLHSNKPLKLSQSLLNFLKNLEHKYNYLFTSLTLLGKEPTQAVAN